MFDWTILPCVSSWASQGSLGNCPAIAVAALHATSVSTFSTSACASYTVPAHQKATHEKRVAFSIPEQTRRVASCGLAFTSRCYCLDRRGPPRLTTINKQQGD
jgi:hypothetical protein